MGRSVRLSTAILCLVLLVPGCAPRHTARSRVTLSYAIWDAVQLPAMRELARDFTRTDPDVGVHVELTPWADYWTRLTTSVTGGNTPDVFWMNGPDFQEFAAGGALRPLDAAHATPSVLARYPAALTRLYSYGGRQYGLPKDMDTVGLWYNRALFDAAGVPYPTSAWTWADFDRAAARLTDPAHGVYATAAPLTQLQETAYDTVFQAGGYVVSPDGRTSGYADPRTVAGLRFWCDLVRKKESPGLAAMTDDAPLQLFESGKLAMYWGGSWDAPVFAGNPYTARRVNVAPLPKGVRRATVIHGLADVVSATTRHPAAAERFADYLASAPAAAVEARSGILPALDSAQEAWPASLPGLDLRAFLDEVPYGVPYPVSKNTAVWNEEEVGELAKAWSGEEPIERAATSLAREMDSALARE